MIHGSKRVNQRLTAKSAMSSRARDMFARLKPSADEISIARPALHRRERVS
jgi:hypothetical protein